MRPLSVFFILAKPYFPPEQIRVADAPLLRKVGRDIEFSNLLKQNYVFVLVV